MTETDAIHLGRAAEDEHLLLRMANRHGLVAGATGTGKTVTLRILAEGFSRAGVPVFAADVKGDLSGLSTPETGIGKPFLQKRADKIGLAQYTFEGFPTVYWDLFGEKGHPVRTTISEMGPLLLSRLMELNDAQEGVLTICFELADDEGMLLLDLKDLRAMLTAVADRADELRTVYGNISAASVGAIQRRLLVLEREGAEHFFGEPALDLADFMRVEGGRGAVNLLAADRLMRSPRLYATFLLWLLSELFEQLPEVGDIDKPKLVFFFDEAHLLFDDAPDALLDKVAQVVRLIRSKGVGVFFVTQNPADIPDEVLGQLGARIQHALRAYTPKERRAIRAAADSFRPNPDFETETVITELGVGEALVSTLDAKGAPSVVARTLIRPPASQLDPLTAEELAAQVAKGPLSGRYDAAVDRDSAFEMLRRRAEQAAAAEERAEAEEARAAAEEAAREAEEDARRSGSSRAYGGRYSGATRMGGGGSGSSRYGGAKSPSTSSRRSRNSSVFGSAAREFARSAGREIGKSLIRGLLGSLRR